MLGRVDYDETTRQTITAWIGGRIDRLLSLGAPMLRGDDVAELSSVDQGQGPLWLGRFLSVFGLAVLFGSLVVIAWFLPRRAGI